VAIDLRLSELLEELHDTGRTPEEVCVDFPELLPELQDRWRRVCRLEAELDTIFPPERDGPNQASSPESGNLPQIPGYEVEGLLGRGGMGVVFRARHLRLNRIVAIKLAIAGAYAASSERERFQREAEAVAALRHPHVVQIYDVGDSEGRPYYTMEFIAGGSLAEKEKPTTPREAALLIRTVAGAVRAAHIGGIIHRDLKPANILLEDDATPKVADFGLSRRLDETTSLTLHGAVIGTPSYMAPEQAAGERNVLGPAVDIYSLGAILYELLTARPPFRAGTPVETVRLVINAEPIPPTRMNARVPRDLEVICLRCLNKDPARRYPSAEALADDLRRFLDGEAIEARPEGRVERIIRRALRRPIYSASIAVGVLVAASSIGGGLWLALDRAEINRRARAEQVATERMAEDDLREMTGALRRRDWTDAASKFERVNGRLGNRGTPELRRLFERARRDLELVNRLEALRLGRARSVGDVIDDAGADVAYGETFRRFGLGDPDEAPEAVAGRIKKSDVRLALVDALDDWQLIASGAGRRDALIRAAKLADREQSGWLGDARDPRVRKDRKALERLVETAPVADQSVTLLLAVAENLRMSGGDPIPMLRRIQQARPEDFWANLSLGSALSSSGRTGEAIRYHQAAVSIRPDVAIANNNLGRCLTDTDRPNEAIECYRVALRLDPSSAISAYNLGYTLRITGRLDEAIEQFHLGLARNPGDALLHAGLGDTLAARADQLKALSEYRAAVSIDPKLRIAQMGLKDALIRLGRLEEARADWRRAIEAVPQDYEFRDGYAEFCLYLGREEDYRESRRDLLDRFGEYTDPRAAERVGRACLFLPSSPEDANRAAMLIDRAIADARSKPPTWTFPYFMLAKGLAEYRLDRFDSAISIMKGEASSVMGPCPRLVISMAEYRLGRKNEAIKTLDTAVRSHDWRMSKADNREAWIYHVLRREAEALIRPEEVSRAK